MGDVKEEWDLEAVYDAEIAPLMSKIIDICEEHRMPMVASFCYRSDPEDTQLCTTALPFKGRKVEALNSAARVICDGEPAHFAAFTITTQEP